MPSTTTAIASALARPIRAAKRDAARRQGARTARHRCIPLQSRFSPLGRLALAVFGVGILAASGLAADGEISMENLQIPRDQVLAGGPPKDGIPALTDPAVIEGARAERMQSADRVIGVSINGEHRAHPLDILAWHEIVNDTLGGTPIAITYCPLCDSAVAFERTMEGQVLEFGVSGLLYQSNVLMYDRSGGAQSLWSQMAGRAVSGPFSGTRLPTVPVELTTWGYPQ